MQEQDECKLPNSLDSTDTLYDRYAASVFAYARLQTASWEDAEDLTLEVFLKALEHDNLSWLAEKQQLVWLRRVAHNKLVDSYRRSIRPPVVPLEQLIEAVYRDEALVPEQLALRREELEGLYKAVGKLSLLQQQMIRLRFGDGLRFAEIGILLNVREEAARKLCSRTLARLRLIYDHDQQ